MLIHVLLRPDRTLLVGRIGLIVDFLGPVNATNKVLFWLVFDLITLVLGQPTCHSLFEAKVVQFSELRVCLLGFLNVWLTFWRFDK
ncbi:hypothetical protein V2J09_019574 [Rumex salicifolius]